MKKKRRPSGLVSNGASFRFVAGALCGVKNGALFGVTDGALFGVTDGALFGVTDGALFGATNCALYLATHVVVWVATLSAVCVAIHGTVRYIGVATAGAIFDGAVSEDAGDGSSSLPVSGGLVICASVGAG